MLRIVSWIFFGLCRVWGSYRHVLPRKENHMEKGMEHDMDTGVM